MDRRQFVAAISAVPLLASQGSVGQATQPHPEGTKTMEDGKDELTAPWGGIAETAEFVTRR